MYALNVMIVCDDRKRIIFYNAGWPGSTHDNRVFRNSKLFYKRGQYFSHHECLLGDSAYSASPVMVQAFKNRLVLQNCLPTMSFLIHVWHKSELHRSIVLASSKVDSSA